MQKIKTTRETNGFSLPAVLILSLTILAMCLALLQTASTVRIDVQGRYYTTLAEEAAEAGANYASTCLALSDHVQTWGVGAFGGDKPNLKPSTDCNGASTYPSITSVYSDSHIETTFDVGQLDTSLPSGAQISSTGTTKIKNTTNGTVIRTYTHIMKKTITWDPNFTSEKSTSGTTRTCGILTGSVYCWGTNAYGQLGNGTDGGGSPSVNASTTPVKVVRDTYPTGIGTKKVIDMSSGGYFNCIIIEGGEVYCWGQNNNGQLGIGSTTPSFSSVPVKVTGLAGKTIVKLGVSANTACALTSTGELYCWGRNGNGNVGIGNTTNPQPTPQRVNGGDLGTKVVSDVSNAGAFNDHICAVALGKAYCWGLNGDGQLGINSTTQQSSPKAVNTNPGNGSELLASMTVVEITGDGNVGDGHTCAIAYTSSPADAKVYCWGSNTNGYLGNGAAYGTTSLVPKAVVTTGVLSGKTISELSVSDNGACVIGYSGSVDNSRAYCWGAANARGDGIPSRTNTPVLVQDAAGIFTSNKVYGLAGGAQRNCAIVKNRSYCWGVNGVGQIGDGTTDTPKRQPTEALFLRPLNNQYVY